MSKRSNARLSLFVGRMKEARSRAEAVPSDGERLDCSWGNRA